MTLFSVPSLWLAHLLFTLKALARTPPSEVHRECPSNTHAVVLKSDFECCATGESDLLFPTCLNIKHSSIDDSDAVHSTEGAFHPWTHAPVCTRILPQVGDKLCVYTNKSFSDGRGISIFTTPSIAEAFLALPPLSSPAPGLNLRTGAWHTAPLERKGIAMFASVELSRGDIITSNTPLLLAYPESDLSTAEREEFWKIAVDQLPEESGKAYYGLMGIYRDDRVKVQDRMKGNAFDIQVGGVMHMAVLPEASRMNHDCGPNAQYYLDSEMLTHHVHATRHIDEGEEITISYATPFASSSTRQYNLQQTFHFQCRCERCVSSSESDRHLLRISDLQQELSVLVPGSRATDATSATDFLEKAKELIELHEDEGLEGFIDEAYGYAALAYNAVGDREMAAKYAKMAFEAVWLRHGPGGQSWLMWQQFLKDLTKQ